MTELEKLYADIRQDFKIGGNLAPPTVSEFTDKSTVGLIDELKAIRERQQSVGSSISETEAEIAKFNERLAFFRYIEAFNAERTEIAETALAKLLTARVSK